MIWPPYNSLPRCQIFFHLVKSSPVCVLLVEIPSYLSVIFKFKEISVNQFLTLSDSDTSLSLWPHPLRWLLFLKNCLFPKITFWLPNRLLASHFKEALSWWGTWLDATVHWVVGSFLLAPGFLQNLKFLQNVDLPIRPFSPDFKGLFSTSTYLYIMGEWYLEPLWTLSDFFVEPVQCTKS